VVVPTFNERDNIAQLVETVFGLYPDIHMLVVDDHSPDGTADVVRGLQSVYRNLMLLERMANPGFGPSYRDGFRDVLAEPWAKAIVTMDADFSHNPAEIAHMLEKLVDNDVVVGSRYAAGGGIGNWGLGRRLLSRGANFYVRSVLGLTAHDATSGFLCLRREALEKLALDESVSDGYAFLVEMKYGLSRACCRMAEHPIVFDERREGQSKMSAGKIWEAVWLPWRIRAGAARADRWNVLVCVLLFLAAAALVNPTLEMGVNDDWSYNHIARDFARTGHIAYNGWTAVMLLPQIVWAAAFIRLFGFSFLLVRLTTLLLTVFCIPAIYYLARESGLRPAFAKFAALLFVLSPLVMPEALSFMSDVPAFLPFIVCLYAGVRAWKAVTWRACAAWAVPIGIAGVVSGLDRQIYWLAPLAFLPVIAWVRRRWTGAVIALGAVWAAVTAVVAVSLRWFLAQPFTLTETWREDWTTHGGRYLASHESGLLAQFALTVAMALVPLLAGFVGPGLRAVSRGAALLIAAGTLAVGMAALVWPEVQAPWLGNVLTEYGAIPAAVLAADQSPVVLGAWARAAITMAVFLCCAGCGGALWKLRKAHGEPLAPVTFLGSLFAAGWLAVVLVRSAGPPAFDRYLIPFLPLTAVPLLWFYQTHVAAEVSRLSMAVLAVFALYGVAVTHDAFAAARARLEAATTLERAGTPRTAIVAGFEYDGWTQVDAEGYLNNPLIANPAWAHHPAICATRRPLSPGYLRAPLFAPGFLQMMPALEVRYVVSPLVPLPGLADGPAGPFAYTTWLPPARRQAFVQTVPRGEYVACQ